MSRVTAQSLLVILAGLVIASGAAAAAPVGWRTDGTGRYPEADPPVKWSATENVLWKTPMPSWSNATPVLVGDRLLVCSEPTTLLCVRLSDGAILWQKTNTYVDALGPAEAEKYLPLLKEIDVEAETKQLRRLEGQLSRAENELKKLANDAKKNPPTDEAKKKAEEFRQQAEEAKKQVEAVKTKLKPVERFVMPLTQGVNGYSSSTPASDGKHVYVLFGTGVAACYDLDGNRQWITTLDKPRDAYGHSASPLVVDGKLITLVAELVALDARTGAVAWKVKAQPRWGTPVAARVGDVEVVITANGDAFRARDGALLANRMGKLDFCSPIVRDGVVYFIEFDGRAAKLPAAPADRLAVEPLWKTQPRKERYYASPVWHDGLIYCIMQQGFASAVDAGTGQVVWEQNMNLGKGTCYPSVTQAGNYIFISSDNGTTAVLEPGRAYKEAARNSLEPFRSSPVFAGKRLYVRGLRNLYCIGQ